jgi:hypothetical protein
VSVDDLVRIKEYGIDVDPIDSHFYCGELEKASEYGGWPKVSTPGENCSMMAPENCTLLLR